MRKEESGHDGTKENGLVTANVKYNNTNRNKCTRWANTHKVIRAQTLGFLHNRRELLEIGQGVGIILLRRFVEKYSPNC